MTPSVLTKQKQKTKIQPHKRFKRRLIYYDTGTQVGHFRGNHPRQATKQHLNKCWTVKNDEKLDEKGNNLSFWGSVVVSLSSAWKNAVFSGLCLSDAFFNLACPSRTTWRHLRIFAWLHAFWRKCFNIQSCWKQVQRAYYLGEKYVTESSFG